MNDGFEIWIISPNQGKLAISQVVYFEQFGC
jgi:hypothetical protein